jgi:hypothetical protein
MICESIKYYSTGSRAEPLLIIAALTPRSNHSFISSEETQIWVTFGVREFLTKEISIARDAEKSVTEIFNKSHPRKNAQASSSSSQRTQE